MRAAGTTRAVLMVAVLVQLLATAAPTAAPTTEAPSAAPTTAPTAAPTSQSPSAAPTAAPTTQSPSEAPTEAPTTSIPTAAPVTRVPTMQDWPERRDLDAAAAATSAAAAQRAADITAELQAMLAGVRGNTDNTRRAKLAEVKADRARVNTTCNNDRDTQDSNRVGMANTASYVAADRAANVDVLLEQKARIIADRTAAKATAEAKNIATDARYATRTTNKNTEATRVLTKLTDDKATQATQTAQFTAEREAFVTAHEAQHTVLDSTTGHSSTAPHVISSRDIIAGGSTSGAPPVQTDSPTDAPTTVAPTAAPTTEAPTAAPVTAAPTAAPTTAAPTAAP